MTQDMALQEAHILCGFLPFPFPLSCPEPFKDRSLWFMSFAGGGWKDCQKQPHQVPCRLLPGSAGRVTPRPGLWKAHLWVTAGSTLALAFYYILCIMTWNPFACQPESIQNSDKILGSKMPCLLCFWKSANSAAVGASSSWGRGRGVGGGGLVIVTCEVSLSHLKLLVQAFCFSLFSNRWPCTPFFLIISVPQRAGGQKEKKVNFMTSWIRRKVGNINSHQILSHTWDSPGATWAHICLVVFSWKGQVNISNLCHSLSAYRLSFSSPWTPLNFTTAFINKQKMAEVTLQDSQG